MAKVQKVGREVPVTAWVERFQVVDAGSGQDVLSKGLDAVKARVSLAKTGQHVEYLIRVSFEGQSWQITKRYNEFAALYEVLKKRLASIPMMPSKSVVRQFAPEYLEQRKNGLSDFLRQVCIRRDAVNCREVQDFLLLRQRVPYLAHPDASEPVQSAEVQEASFGIAHFDYDPVQGLLLMGSSDFSWASRVDTKITNIKMPWEKKAPNLPSSQMSVWQQSPAELKFAMQNMNRFTSLISCVVMANCRDKATCLAGLSDGTVGMLPFKAERGAPRSESLLPLVTHTASVVALAVDESEQWLFSASADKAIKVFDLKHQRIQCEVQVPAPATHMIHCQEQMKLFASLKSGVVVVYDTSILPMQRVASIPDSGITNPNPITAMDYDASTGTLFTGSKDGIILWTVKMGDMGGWGRRVAQIASMEAPTSLAWAQSSREIIAGFENGAVVVFDMDRNQGEPSYAIQAHADGVTAVKWLDAPRRLFTASKDKTLKIWDFPSMQRAPLDPSFVPQASHAPEKWGSFSGPSQASWTRGADPLRDRTGSNLESEGPQGFSGGHGGYPGGTAAPVSTSAFTGGAAPIGHAVVSSAAPGAVSGAVSYTGAKTAPIVVGAAPSAATAAEDSDEDLAGWDN